ncbi:MAG: UDP-N-acetylmuramoyl-L-alanyl-D-glutamate--2,6-diaminopimelate ligase [Bacteroidota bacterium]
MQLSELISELELTATYGSTEQRLVQKLTFDSREVEKDSLFVAISGTRVDGHDYIKQALEAGATVIVAEHGLAELADSTSACLIELADSSAALGQLAAQWYGQPSHQLQLIGVTGTNGKTTVTTLLHELFSGLGYKAGLLSTVSIRIGQQEKPATHTTPDALSLNAALAEMVAAGVDYAFMEVSSHAVDQRRIAGLRFTGGVFTNMSHDHLDYHQTFQAYIEAKKMFFDTLPTSAFALVNIDDKRGPVMVQNTAAQIARYSLRRLADFRAKVLDNSPAGLQLEINGIEVFTRLLGRFNAYNLLAAYGTAMLLEHDSLETLTALSNLRAPNGRLEYLQDASGQRTAIVDYAHTPDALQNVLATLRQTLVPAARLLCVVGAGGDRDRTKRPEMARIAAGLTDQLILTSDNPRTENPEAILDDMEAGLTKDQRTTTLRITDRRSAIATALRLAQPGDLVLVAGKGHETYQEIQGKKLPFDDKEVIRETFATLS